MKTFKIKYKVIQTCEGTLDAESLEEAQKKWDAGASLWEDEKPSESEPEFLSIEEVV